jgi:TonB family protein
MKGVMPHALLLSPDDQAVSAISAVLEEMSVSCERPLDGASAAQKLNSRSFDLVLVDCENLPAAKLIFDVCRRGKSDMHPVPIAIVDGRAGLPTAFRLGAELILTKPVAKDQARSTIRTAVSRLRKEEPACAAEAPEEPSVATATPAPPVEPAMAAAAAASSQSVRMFNETPAPDIASAPEVCAAVEEMAAAPAVPLPEPVSPVEVIEAKDNLEASTRSAKLSDDPVLADLDRGDVGPSLAMASASSDDTMPKRRSPMLAVVIIALVAGGIYAGWMYQPAFRALVQPLVNRVLASAQQKTAAAAQAAARIPKPISVKPAAAPAPQPGTSTSGDPDSPARVPASEPAAMTPVPASAPATTKPESLADSRRTGETTASSLASLSDEGVVILSSKGAEKRLVRQVPPALPSGASASDMEGTVILKTLVDDTGKVESVHLVEGNPALADPAIRAVEQWRYRPYIRDGKSLPFQTIVLVDFQRP